MCFQLTAQSFRVRYRRRYSFRPANRTGVRSSLKQAVCVRSHFMPASSQAGATCCFPVERRDRIVHRGPSGSFRASVPWARFLSANFTRVVRSFATRRDLNSATAPPTGDPGQNGVDDVHHGRDDTELQQREQTLLSAWSRASGTLREGSGRSVGSGFMKRSGSTHLPNRQQARLLSKSESPSVSKSLIRFREVSTRRGARVCVSKGRRGRSAGVEVNLSVHVDVEGRAFRHGDRHGRRRSWDALTTWCIRDGAA